ncbi:MAG: hypothetical protein O3A00_25615, partial [Planctomycetota bacterium]|nr:hypothetical protein [Planctomycetota bacterium]
MPTTAINVMQAVSAVSRCWTKTLRTERLGTGRLKAEKQAFRRNIFLSPNHAGFEGRGRVVQSSMLAAQNV